MNGAMRKWFAISALLVTACGTCGGDPAQDTANIVDAPNRGELLLLVTVDWEGRDLLDANLEAMRSTRARFTNVPMVQFLNAAYFTKPNVDRDDAATRMRSVLTDADELGLHIHGWKRLFEAAGVTFRDTPTFWGPPVPASECGHDCGHEVPISAYDPAELSQVIRFSVDTLDERGFGRAVSFRAGGWMAEPHVLQALASEGFVNDSSAVPATFLAGEIGHLPLHQWIEDLWEGTASRSQPYRLEGLTEVPDNGALADYVTGDEMFAVYLEAKKRLADDPERDVVVNIGFHQETAEKYLPRIEDALTRILDDARVDDVPLRPTTMSAL